MAGSSRHPLFRVARLDPLNNPLAVAPILGPALRGSRYSPSSALKPRFVSDPSLLAVGEWASSRGCHRRSPAAGQAIAAPADSRTVSEMGRGRDMPLRYHVTTFGCQ